MTSPLPRCLIFLSTVIDLIASVLVVAEGDKLLMTLLPYQLLVPRTRTVIRQRRAFSVASPTAWNGLPVALTPVAHSALFLSGLKTTLFDRGWAGSTPE